MIGFEAPLALLGLAFVAIPLGLHFFVRTRPPLAVLPTARFLESVPRARRSFSRPKDVLVLAARLLGLVALVIAAARPFARESAPAGSGPALVLILDDTLSMAHGQPSRLERAKHSLVATLDALPEGARATLLTTSKPRAPLEDRARVRARLVATEASAGTGSLLAALETAGDLAREASGARVIVASDFDRAALQDLERRGPAARALAVEIVDVGQDTARNAWLAGVELEPETAVAGVPLEVRARVASRGLDSAQEIPVTLTLADGTRQEARARPGERVRFHVAHPEAGLLRGELLVSAPGDALALDDRVDFGTVVHAQLDVVFARGDGDADEPIRQALEAIAHAPGTAIALTTADQADLPRALETARVLVLGPSSPRAPVTLAAIARFVERGGGLVAFSDEGTHDLGAAATRTTWLPGAVRARPASAPLSLEADETRTGAPLARGLGALALAPQTELVPDARATVVLKDSAGAALWIEEGRVALLGFAPSGRNEALANETVFPLVVRRALGAALGGATVLDNQVGDALEPAALARACGLAPGPAPTIHVASPAGVDRALAGGDPLILDTAGVWQIRSAAGEVIGCTTARPAEIESRLERAGPEALQGGGDAALASSAGLGAGAVPERDDRTLRFALVGLALLACAQLASSLLAPGATSEAATDSAPPAFAREPAPRAGDLDDARDRRPVSLASRAPETT